MLRIDALVGRWSSNGKLNSLLFNFAYQLIIMLLRIFEIRSLSDRYLLWLHSFMTIIYHIYITYSIFIVHVPSFNIYVRKHTSLLVVSATRRKWTLTVTMSILTLMVIQPSLAPPTSPGTGVGPMRSYSGIYGDKGGLPRPRNGRKNWRVI